MVTPILSVTDIDSSIAYYTTRLGIVLIWRLTGDEDRATFASLTLANSEIMLETIDFVAPADRQKLGTGVQFHLELPLEIDIEELFTAARASGADIVKELEKREWGEWAYVVNDLGGYNFMIAQPSSQPPPES